MVKSLTHECNVDSDEGDKNGQDEDDCAHSLPEAGVKRDLLRFVWSPSHGDSPGGEALPLRLHF